MKTKIIALALVVAGLFGGYGLYRLGMNQGAKTADSATDGRAVAAGTATNRKPLYWQDPMNPGQKFDKPGKSPFMDMELVPVYGDDGNDAGKVVISPRVEQNLGIRTAEVSKGKLTPNLVAVGSVAYNDRDVALVQARSNGFVERLYVRALLDPVKKGQPLAELFVPDWIAAQEEYLTVKRMQGSGMDLLLDGARQRMRLAGMGEDQIRLVEASGKVHPRITITAPVGGVVAELSVREGMTVMAGAPLFRINGLASVWINAEIPENFAAKMRPGNAVNVSFSALPGVSFKGKIDAILPEVNAATRTLKARIELVNPSGQLVPGMFASVDLTPTRNSEALLVPSEAVIQTGTRSVVIVAQGAGKFISVDVKPGAESNGQTEIMEGLEAGQKVVVSGQFLIDSEASLKGTSVRMGETSAPDLGMKEDMKMPATPTGAAR
jgi:Cu(I)/Ag(I) efflux system membrane fusion protein